MHFVHGKRYSILPVLTLDGIVVYDIIEGSVTAEWFIEFVREMVVSSFVILCYTFDELRSLDVQGHPTA